jgi:hypothetical protein
MIVATTLIALSTLTASVDAAVLRRHKFPVPSTYDAAYLESYDSYHSRYIALSCYTKHNTTFFDDCCHPLLKSEKLETARPAKCIPGSSDNADDDEDCDDSDNEPQVPSGPANAADDPADPANQSPSSEAEPSPTSTSPPPAAPTSEKPNPASSENPKPASSESPKPASSESPKPTTTTTTSQKPASTSGVGGLLSNLFNAFSLASDIKSGGIATFFTQNGNAGNCGQVHQDSEHVVALPTSTYANGAHCGKKIAIVDRDTGKSATAIVADSCPTCPDPNSLDLSTSLFDLFATPEAGIFNVAWAFIE